ncbi:nucleoside deaminase [Ornithinibacillus californiensis]|uniref:nucleoside deaminase n=1 Tax=Ornithinibacillus californiensis TaxID=161536 RepID=UPI00064DC287|nr:nucleoside deaminase [Ornithinibacillus californiensis]
MDTFMERAVELAIDNVKEGGQPFGAVLVKDDQIIAEGVNELHKKHDVSGHAELIAIRRAQAKLDRSELAGYTMYASGEPCPMCLTAMYFAGIDKVFYCQSIEDAFGVGLTKSQFIYKELKVDKADRSIEMKQMPLQESQVNPLLLWQTNK